MSARFLRLSLFAAVFASVFSLERVSEAGPVLDWLFGRRPVYYPVGAPVAVPAAPGTVPLANNCVRVPYAPLNPAVPTATVGPGTAAMYAPAGVVPTTALMPAVPLAQNYGVAAAGYSNYPFQAYSPPRQVAAQPIIGQPVVPSVPLNPYSVPAPVPAYVSAPTYQSAAYPVPVTNYRPVTTVNPVTGQQQVVLQPCTTYEWQARRVPNTAYQPIRGFFGRTYYAPTAPVAGQAAYAIPTVAPGVGVGTVPDAIGYSAIPSANAYALPGSSGLATSGFSNGPTYGSYPSTGSSLGSSISPSVPSPGSLPSSGWSDGTPLPNAGSSIPSATTPYYPDLNSSPSSPYPSRPSREPADERPNLNAVPEVETAPSVSIQGSSGFGMGTRKEARYSDRVGAEIRASGTVSDANSSNDRNTNALNRIKPSFSDEPIEATVQPRSVAPWRTPNRSDSGESAARKSNAKPIPDPDRVNDLQRITPPTLLTPDDRTVSRPTSGSSRIASASYRETSAKTANTDRVVEAKPPVTSQPKRRTVLDDSAWKPGRP